MRAFVTIELMKRTVEINDIGLLQRDVSEYISKTGVTDFLLPPEDYMQFAAAHATAYSHVFQGRTEDDMPYFMSFGIKFTMLSNEEADKYRILI